MQSGLFLVNLLLSDGVASPLIQPTSKGRLVKPKAPSNKVSDTHFEASLLALSRRKLKSNSALLSLYLSHPSSARTCDCSLTLL